MSHDTSSRTSSYYYSILTDVTTYSFPDNNFVLTKAPTDYVTIEYGYNNPDSEEHEWIRTGGLKIITLNEDILAGGAYSGGSSIRADGDVIL